MLDTNMIPPMPGKDVQKKWSGGEQLRHRFSCSTTLMVSDYLP
jgi:hypothetical protein